MKRDSNVKVKIRQRFGKRVQCLGGCRTWVLVKNGECRKCRRRRVHAGRKRVYKLNKAGSV